MRIEANGYNAQGEEEGDAVCGPQDGLGERVEVGYLGECDGDVGGGEL
jgi:hypothetical protein